MKHTPLRRRVLRTSATLTTAALLLTTLLAAVGAGPDEPKASGTGGDWQVFEGHAFADGRIVPEGVSLVACLGGCERGYVSQPALVEQDGRYRDLTIAPGQASRPALPDGDLITFWLVEADARVSAVQSWLYTGDGQTRKLHLSFKNLPAPSFEVGSGGIGSREVGLPGVGSGGVRPERAAEHSSVTTDLTVPGANRLGLASDSLGQSYIAGVSYGGVPLLPGIVVGLGLLAVAVGIALLRYRRRLTW